MARRQSNPGRPVVDVRYDPLGTLNVYEISEAELDKLAGGPPGQLHLGFALALLPASLTMLVTLQTVEIADARVYYSYWIAFWVFFIQGTLALARWRSVSSSTKSLIEQIKSRMPSPAVDPEKEVDAAPPAS